MIVLKWSDEHPVKTRQDILLDMFPKAMRMIDDGTLDVMPCRLDESLLDDGGMCPLDKTCIECRREFWNKEVRDETD